MPAYKLRLEKATCQEEGCKSLAKYEVFNTFNAKCGKFCTRHACLMEESLNRGHKIDA